MSKTYVITYFDDEQTAPAEYIVQLREGLFEVHGYDEDADNSDRIIGIFVNWKAALRAAYHRDREWCNDF